MSNGLTAMDIEKQEFGHRMRGYDPEEVRLYLQSVASEVERLTLENGQKLEDLGRLRSEIDEVRSREKVLQQTLITAQRMAEEMQHKAREESDLVIRQAQFRAEQIVKQSQDALGQLEADIGRCKIERDSFERRLRDLIEQHLTLLDMRSGARGELDNLRVLPGRVGSEAG